MFKPQFTITNKIAAFLTEIERAKGFLEAATLSQEWLEKMQNKALVFEAHYTTHIEGTEFTLQEAQQILAGEKIASANVDDLQELLNYRDAFEFVSKYLESGDPITEALIREIHKKIVNNVRGNASAPGEYRKIQNYVMNSNTKEIVYTPPPAYEVAIMMTDLITWLNNEYTINAVLIAGIAQFQLVHIHPFLDGNGRAARLLSMLSLYRSGYDFKKLFNLSQFYDRDKSAYYAAIQSVRANNLDMTLWLEYFCEGLATQLIEVKQEGANAIKHDVIIKQFSLSERQGLIVSILLKSGSVTIHDYQSICPDVTKRTLQRELKTLVDKGMLVAEGSTHQLIYKFAKQEIS